MYEPFTPSVTKCSTAELHFVHLTFIMYNYIYTGILLSLQDDVCMHLTNYSINKNSKNFVRDEDTGSKR